MVDGSVMVTFIPKQSECFCFIRYELQNKWPKGVLKSLILYINDIMERYYI